MALIKCDECGKEISSKAKTCPNCGNPINSDSSIKIKMPEKIGNMNFNSLTPATYAILDEEGNVLEKKRAGEIFEMESDKVVKLQIKVAGLGGAGLKGVFLDAKPGGRYVVTHTPYSFNPLSVGEVDIL